MALGSRPEETIVEERGRPKRVPGPTDIPLKDKRGDEEVNIPINNPETSREPYIITEADLRRSTPDRSPQPKFAGEVRSTEDDLKAIEEARRAAEAHPGQLDFEEDETAQLKKQVQELTGLVQQLVTAQAAKDAESAEVAPKKAAAKKAPAKKRGRPKKAGSVSPMDAEGKGELTSKDLME